MPDGGDYDDDDEYWVSECSAVLNSTSLLKSHTQHKTLAFYTLTVLNNDCGMGCFNPIRVNKSHLIHKYTKGP